MRDSGKASKSAIQGVIKDIHDYTTILQKELQGIQQEAATLTDVWQDEKCKQFLECVERMKIAVERELESMEHARRELEKKVGIMEWT